MGGEWCAGANRVDTTRLAERSALPIEDAPTNPVELLKLDALGFVATAGGIETATTYQEGRGALDAGLRCHVLKEPALRCVKGQGATEAPHGRTPSNAVAVNEA